VQSLLLGGKDIEWHAPRETHRERDRETDRRADTHTERDSTRTRERQRAGHGMAD
jgi:hypothetical protein